MHFISIILCIIYCFAYIIGEFLTYEKFDQQAEKCIYELLDDSKIDQTQASQLIELCHEHSIMFVSNPYETEGNFVLFVDNVLYYPAKHHTFNEVWIYVNTLDKKS